MLRKFKKVLLIDDDEINNELNQIILEKFDFAEKALVFVNGSEALTHIKNNYLNGKNEELPEVIFLDIKMPVMDGFEFLEQLGKLSREFVEKVPVYILTSSRNQQDIERANAFDIAGFFSKPLSPGQLEKILSSTDA